MSRSEFVRAPVAAFDRTVYPTFDRSVLVRVTSSDGAEGWGETYGLVAPAATTAIIDDLLGDFVVGRDPFDAAAIHDDLYDLMRVRRYTGGFYLDALAAVGIALWELTGQLSGRRSRACSAAGGGPRFRPTCQACRQPPSTSAWPLRAAGALAGSTP